MILSFGYTPHLLYDFVASVLSYVQVCGGPESV